MKIGTIGITAAMIALVGMPIAMPAVAANQSETTVGEIIPALAAPQSARDRVPDVVDLTALNISEESVRLVASDGASHYWVGRAGTSKVCLIIAIDGDSPISATSCTPITTFYNQGIGLLTGKSIEVPAESAEAYLLPADIEPSAISTSNARTLLVDATTDANILVVPAQSSGLETREVRRRDGTVFRFSPISLEGR